MLVSFRFVFFFPVIAPPPSFSLSLYKHATNQRASPPLRARKQSPLLSFSDDADPPQLDADAPRRPEHRVPVVLRHLSASFPSPLPGAPPQESSGHLRRGPRRGDGVARLSHDAPRGLLFSFDLFFSPCRRCLLAPPPAVEPSREPRQQTDDIREPGVRGSLQDRKQGPIVVVVALALC